jgi:hypothetical protein
MSQNNEPKSNVTEKSIKELDFEDVSWDALERYTHGGAKAGQNRAQINHDKTGGQAK